MSGMLIPEGIIEDSLQKALDHIRAEYIAATDKTKTLLIRMTDNQAIGTFNYSEQLVNSLITTEKDPNHIRIKQSYDPTDKNYRGVYLNMNEETEAMGSIGQGMGDHGLGEDQDVMYFDDDEGTASDIYAKRYNSSFYITIMSDNKNEAIGLYHFFKLLLVGIFHHLNESDIQNVKMSGRGVSMDQRVPSGLFVRSINFSFNYEAYSHDFYSRIVPSIINLTGTIITD